ncbi:MAG: hypothetical protein JO287_21535 [Pseudonocardiales bacterium]|nr:hypothetical protein [Pseudonocardiales bacterium]
MRDPRELSVEAADLYVTAITRAIRSMTDVGDLPAAGTPLFELLTMFATEARQSTALKNPVVDQPRWADADFIAALAADCAVSVAERGTKRKGKTNAPVSDQLISRLLGEIDVVNYMAEATGLKLTGGSSAAYIAYDDPPAALQLHFDRPGLAISVCCCASKRPHQPQGVGKRNNTCHRGWLREYRLGVGECLIIDGVSTLHGRTPLSDGEMVQLLSLGFAL